MFGSRRFTEKMQKRVKVSLSSVKQDKPSDEKKAEEGSCPPPAQPELSLPPSSGPGDKKKLVTQDTLDSARLSQTPSVSSEDALSPVVRRECFNPDARPGSAQCIHLFIYLLFFAPNCGPGAVNSPTSDVVKETDDRLPPVPLQGHVFSECSRERILGLLAAMLPPAKPVRDQNHFVGLKH